MRLRSGFVSNSSSTSFLIISKDELTEASFFSLMGVSTSSPLAPIFRELFRDVIRQGRTKVDFSTADPKLPIEFWFEDERLSDRMKDRLRQAKKEGLRAYYGMLSSDHSNVQTFFCTDSFEVEDERIYFNALENAW